MTTQTLPTCPLHDDMVIDETWIDETPEGRIVHVARFTCTAAGCRETVHRSDEATVDSDGAGVFDMSDDER